MWIEGRSESLESILAGMLRQNAVAAETHRRPFFKFGAGFTLIELLLTIAIISILAALLASALVAAKGKAQRATCMNDLRQIALGVRMYSDDANDKSPASTNAWRYPYAYQWSGN